MRHSAAPIHRTQSHQLLQAVKAIISAIQPTGKLVSLEIGLYCYAWQYMLHIFRSGTALISLNYLVCSSCWGPLQKSL